MFVLLHVRHVRSVSRRENEPFVQHVLIVLSWALLSPRPCPPDASTPGYLSELTSHCVLHLFFFLPLSFFFSSSLPHILLSLSVLRVIFSSSFSSSVLSALHPFLRPQPPFLPAPSSSFLLHLPFPPPFPPPPSITLPPPPPAHAPLSISRLDLVP